MEEVAFGRYRLRELIGEGGMGQVFRAHDTVIGRDVAIKVLPPEMGSLDGYRDRFRREAHIAARLTEPHIIPIHDTGEIDGRLYLVMPIIEGVDVQTLLRREGPMPPPLAVRVIEQLAAALNAAHRNSLVHRDIKPSNALMTDDGHVYLIDFGIAHDAAATRLTQTGMMVGTFSYMAPERFLTGTADARADVYSLSCVLHECLTGATPFPGTSMEQQIAGHLTMDPPRPSTFSPAIPAAFDEVIAHGMAKQPQQRYQTAAELAAAAQHALSAASPPPQPPPPAPPPPPVGPVDPTMPGTQQLPYQPTQLAPTLVATPPAAATIGVGRFASVLCGVALLSVATAYLLGPWRETDWSLKYHAVPSVLTWILIAAVIPGVALLALGRGRTRADKTIAGCALVALGIGTALSQWLQALEPSGLLGIVGLLILLIAMAPRPTHALARGVLHCGAGILALAFVDVLTRPYRGVFVPSFSLVIGSAFGVIVVTAGGIACRRAAGRPLTPPPDGPSLGTGRFGCVLIGVVILASSVALALVPRSHSWKISFFVDEGYRSLVASLAWLVMLGVIPGIALLVLGRGRARADETIAGCALVALAPSWLLFAFVPIVYFVLFSLLAIAGLLLSLVPAFPRPTPGLARGYLLCGAGILVLAVVATAYRLQVIYIPDENLVIAFAVGLILLVASLVARQMARLPAAAARR